MRVLSGGTQRCAVPRYQSEEMKMLHILLPQVGIEPTTVAFTDVRLRCATTARVKLRFKDLNL